MYEHCPLEPKFLSNRLVSANKSALKKSIKGFKPLMDSDYFSISFPQGKSLLD
jgi:hypothetical protein